MLNKLIQKITQINKAAGIEITFTDRNEYFITTVVASNNKGKINKENIKPLSDINALPLHVKKDIPLYLIVTGKGILIKTIFTGEGQPTLESILPGANPADFYTEIIQQNESTTITLGRKEVVNNLINKLKTLEYKILGLSIGHASVQEIGNQIKENLPISNKELPAFSGAISLLTADLKEPSSLNSNISEERKEYRAYRLFKTASLSALAFFLVLLLTNFFLYDYYFKKNKELKVYNDLSEEQLKKINRLEKSISEKDLFLQHSGWTKQTKNSLLADRIASMVPGSAVLTTLNIHPIETSNIFNNSLPHFKKDTIVLTGLCDNPSELDQFVNNLKNIDYLKDITIKNYQYNKEKETGSFLMEIITK